MSGENIITKSDFEGATADTQREIRRQAELYLAAQLQSGIAADQRAMSFVSLMAAAAVVTAGGGGSLIIADKPQVALGWICIAIAASFVIAMGAAASSAMAVDFWYGGSTPQDWPEDIRCQKPEQEMLAEELVNLEVRTSDNVRTLRRNARWMNIGIWTAWGGLTVGGAAGAIVLFFK